MLSKLYRAYPVVRDIPNPNDLITPNIVLTPEQQSLENVDLRPWCGPIKDQGQSSACHDSETEVLTQTGWKLFENITFEDKLATINPETAELLYENPTNLIKYQFNGQLITADRMGLNFKVTPNHNMLVKQWSEKNRTLANDFSLVEASKLGWYSGLLNNIVWNGSNPYSETYILKGIENAHLKKDRRDKLVKTETWLKFLGIYLAEGTMLARDQRKKPAKGRTKVGVSYKIQIAGFKEREKDFIRTLLKDLNVNTLELAGPSNKYTTNPHCAETIYCHLNL